MQTIRRIVELMLAVYAALSGMPPMASTCRAHGKPLATRTSHGAALCPACQTSLADLTDAYRYASRRPSVATASRFDSP